MSWFVGIKALNGRNDYVKLASLLYERGYTDEVSYFNGGWTDSELIDYLPFLKFDNEGDATAWVLSFGGICTARPPTRYDHIVDKSNK